MTEYTAVLRGNNFRPIEAKMIVNNLIGGEALNLVREPGNQFDPNAIMVLDPATDIHLGYVAKEIAADGLADEMDEGMTFTCTVESNMMRQCILSITTFPGE